MGKEEEGGSLEDGGEWVISLEDLCALLQHIYTPLVKSARPCEPLWRAPPNAGREVCRRRARQ